MGKRSKYNFELIQFNIFDLNIMNTEPLSSRIRPRELSEFIGQEHLVGPEGPMRIAVEKGHRFSFILWGPPGCGKTTLARIYSEAIGGELFELSAVSAGKADVKKIINFETEKEKVLFLDEIHRFNKIQQDLLLPYVEDGRMILIGATTENPSFEIISPLMSRCKLFTLKPLKEEELKKLWKRSGLKADKKALDLLAFIVNGDARQFLSVAESVSSIYGKLTEEGIKKIVNNGLVRYDKKGDEHYNTISAYIKSMRAGQIDAALYYLARMIEAGEDPKFIARRMIIFASEDIGQALPTALVVANEVFTAVEKVGLPEAEINLAHGTVYLAEAPKDRTSYDAYRAAQADVHNYKNLPVPFFVKNAPNDLMRQQGHGEGYEMYTGKSMLPDKLRTRKYYRKKKK